MILTITLNASVDIGYTLDTFKIDDVNRTQDVSKTAGGKGLNVAKVLKQLNEDVGASGFLGGSLGDFIRKQLDEIGIHDNFAQINGETRNCIAVIHEGQQTEILESGPTISEQEAQDFLTTFTQKVAESSIVTISGSLPKGLPNTFYQKMIAITAEQDTPSLLDTKGSLLRETLQGASKPYMIKPNEDELADLLGRPINGVQDLKEALKDYLFADVPLVVVTLGADGAIVKNGKQLYQAKAPKIDAVNPVGSGDSVVAGFASGLSRGLTDEKLIAYGLSMGVLNALEVKTGHINSDHIDWCIAQMDVTKLD